MYSFAKCYHYDVRRVPIDSFELVLNGGLGNQLFGYAAGKSIEQQTGLKCIFVAPGKNDRFYELDKFGISAEFRKPSRPHPFRRNLGNRLSRAVFPNRFRHCEMSFRFDQRFYSHTSGKTLYGYFQSYLYFEGISKQLLNLPHSHVQFSNEYLSLLAKYGQEDFIAVHIRRGDYVGKENYHGLVKPEYFSAGALEILKAKPEAKFIVFSDSIDLAKEIFPIATDYISSQMLPRPSENLILMSKMGGLIGSNSSLSWWVGYLNQKIDVNLFPSPWFANSQLDTSDLIPPGWKLRSSGIRVI